VVWKYQAFLQVQKGKILYF